MSTFVLRREYALQMPTNYVDIDMDEMEYVDGGGVPNYVVSGFVNAALTIAGAYNVFRAGKLLLSMEGKTIGRRVINNILARIGFATSLWNVDNIIKIIAGFVDPIGSLVGYLDKLDGSKDSWVGGNGWTTWSWAWNW